jgi:hypothetical protein
MRTKNTPEIRQVIRPVVTDDEPEAYNSKLILNREQKNQLTNVCNWMTHLSEDAWADDPAHRAMLKMAETAMSYIYREAFVLED